jgi:hypothetical protein
MPKKFAAEAARVRKNVPKVAVLPFEQFEKTFGTVISDNV